MPSILLMEDDDLFREALALALREHGFTVREARDGDEGTRLFRVEPTDLVLTDIVMPKKEGLETVLELRRAHPKLGIIVMSGGTAHDAPLYLKMAASFGANRVLKKPFSINALLTAVTEVLAASPRAGLLNQCTAPIAIQPPDLSQPLHGLHPDY